MADPERWDVWSPATQAVLEAAGPGTAQSFFPAKPRVIFPKREGEREGIGSQSRSSPQEWAALAEFMEKKPFGCCVPGLLLIPNAWQRWEMLRQPCETAHAAGRRRKDEENVKER
ncbi:hypothetical protein Q8A67_020270 [Cirrhinus molitorella]|uniref:Uncharacterized protein n=1 Tax=Cirrhinus molitorella TaxID=172907 RepID=A0AA88P4X9_9TELE|nr:hypothetical protein Q8A67_020270 [Cirrhinus molitorella]